MNFRLVFNGGDFNNKKKNMAKKTFKIRAKFVFGGQVKVKAHSRKEAETIAEKNIAVLLGKVKAFDDDIVNWDFPIHSDTVINRKEQREEGEV